MAVFGFVATLLGGVGFGLAIAAPPGPMNAIIAEESVHRGWTAGFKAGLGAMTADACFFVLALVGAVAVTERFPSIRGLAFAVGGALMLYFAYGAAQDATASIDGSDAERSHGFRKAFVLAITNPYQIVFWLTVGVGLLEPGQIDVFSTLPAVGETLSGALVVTTGSPTLLIGFFTGIVVWIVGFPATLVAAESRSTNVGPAIAYASALVLAGFGVIFLGEAASVFSGTLT